MLEDQNASFRDYLNEHDVLDRLMHEVSDTSYQHKMAKVRYNRAPKTHQDKMAGSSGQQTMYRPVDISEYRLKRTKEISAFWTSGTAEKIRRAIVEVIAQRKKDLALKVATGRKGAMVVPTKRWHSTVDLDEDLDDEPDDEPADDSDRPLM